MSDRPRKRRKKLRATFSVEGMPELMARVYASVAQMIREVAEDEAPAVAARLRAIADVFETGLTQDLPEE
jgi:hypothetical protein